MDKTSWIMWAHDEKGAFFHLGEKRWVELHGIDLPIVEVKVDVDKNGTYYGWLRSNRDVPTMIWPSKIQFEMCFPYGPKIEEEKGKGKVLRLSIKKTEV